MSLVTSEPGSTVAPTGQASERGSNPAIVPRPFILTTACPDTTGIVAGISGFLASQNALITEAQHYDDPYGNTSFMRTVFHDHGHDHDRRMPPMDELNEKFGSSVGRRFGMKLNRAIKWHAERRVFRNGHKTVVLR